MGRAFYNLFLTWLLGLAAPSFAQMKYDDSTTGGTTEDSTQFGGISDAEYLNQAEQAALKKFREGRESSAKNPGSRFSGLEFHDKDGDGLTDHDYAANDLEGGMDITAIGKKGLFGEERQKKLQEARNTKGPNCVPIKGPDGKTIYIRKGSNNKDNPYGDACDNISANLVDMGAAHGDDATSPHRVYELTDEAYKESKKENSDYVQSMFNSAANYDAQKYGLGVAKNIGPNGSQIQVQQPDGKTEIVNVAPDIDLLRSEAAWLEQQKLAAIKKHRLSLTMKKYLDAEGSDFDKGASSLVWSNASKDVLAQRIAEDGPVGKNAFVFNSGSGRPTIITKKVYDDETRKCQDTSNYPTDDAQRACLNKYSNLSAFMADSQTSGEDKKRLWEEGRKVVAADPDREIQEALKKAQADVNVYKECLETGNWCINKNKVEAQIRNEYAKKKVNLSDDQLNKELKKRLPDYDPKNNGRFLYKLAQGQDVGEAFNDTREYNLTNLELASEGPLANFENQMRGYDLGPETDQKTGSKQWARIKAEIDMARNTYKNIKESQKKLEKENPGYKSKYLGDQFDENTQNTYDLFMRQAGRDGTTFGWGNTQAQNPGQSPGAQSPKPARRPANTKAKPSGPWNQSNFNLD